MNGDYQVIFMGKSRATIPGIYALGIVFSRRTTIAFNVSKARTITSLPLGWILMRRNVFRVPVKVQEEQVRQRAKGQGKR